MVQGDDWWDCGVSPENSKVLPNCQEGDSVMTVCSYVGTVNNLDLMYCNEQAKSRLFLVNKFRESCMHIPEEIMETFTFFLLRDSGLQCSTAIF